MMKATLKRGSRKKSSQAPTTAPTPPVLPAAPPPMPVAAPAPMALPSESVRDEGSRRSLPPPDQPSAAEVALTNKNYRLAKELSELRVRHREECKNVTRLTMENMNLASRCREAISHVAMLKKELALHQKRAKESLALQRAQNQRMASNLSEASRLSRSFSDDSQGLNESARSDTMERVLAMDPPPPPARSQDPPAAAHQREKNSIEEDGEDTGDDTEDDTVVETARRGRSVLDVVESLSERAASPPKVFSTPNRPREGRWTPRIDDAPGSEPPSFFPKSASPSGPSSPFRRNYNEEFPTDIQPQRTPSKSTPSQESRGVITMNSIDAFEASFNTTFPDSFPKDGSSARKKKTSTEIYNPFAPSPARKPDRGTPPSPEPAMERNASTGSSRANDPPLVHSPEVVRTARLADTEPFSQPNQYQTPTKRSSEPAAVSSAEPPRPQKVASSESRARYEKAMQPRPEPVDCNSTHSSSNHSSHSNQSAALAQGSPSSLLQRIQERRKQRESGDAPDPSPRMLAPPSPFHTATTTTTTTSTPSPAPTPSEEPATTARTISARLNAIKRRTKQPISYAEPALNTKLRQGDTFFPKDEATNPAIVVSPEQYKVQ
eukprot:Nitzschia sp. Nitz4//scaffold47_size129522//125277//127273//NITZ4_003573-RA/size129522-snap-gene-0.204-mRNA-1//-1//CDS//3329552866//9171//frame0